MNSWARYPFIRLLIPLVIGILTCYFTNGIFQIRFSWLVVVLFCIIVYNSSRGKFSTYRYRGILGLMLSFLIFMLGYFLTQGTFLENQDDHFSKIHSDDIVYKAQIINQPVSKGKRIKCLLSINEVFVGTTTRGTKGLVICYVLKGSHSSNLQYGDHLIFRKTPEQFEEPGNPGEFNYKAYLSHKSIFHQVFLDSSSYKLSSQTAAHSIKGLALEARDRFLDIIKNHQVSNNEFSVAAALFTGYDEFITDDQRDQFANSGIMHILSVSGLHVGIVFMLTNYLLFFLNRKDRLQFLKPTICIAVIWFYAIITGLAPPVCRASLMFTLIILGKLTRHQSNTYNTLAIAAFFLLLANPRLLFDVGFQLSFSAVAGIIYFQPYFKDIYLPSNKLSRYTWDLLTISIAAQLATAPLTIYYFHKFPNYFLLSNLIAIPITGIIIYTGAGLLIASFIPFLSKYLVLLLNIEIKALNVSIDYINQLPGLVSDNLYLSGYSLILWMILILSTFSYVKENSRELLMTSIVACILLIGLSIYRNYEIDHQKMIVFHKSSKHPAISVVTGRRHLLLTDSIVCKNPALIKYQVDGFKLKTGLTNTSYQRVNKDETIEFYNIDNKKIAIIQGHSRLPRLPEKKESVDYVYIQRCNSRSIIEYARYFKGAIVLFEPYTKDQAADIEAQMIEMGVSFHNLKKSGALLVSL